MTPWHVNHDMKSDPMTSRYFACSGAMARVVTCVFYVTLSPQQTIMKITDQRVRKTNEVLDGIKVIKLYGWEDSFVEVSCDTSRERAS